MIRFPWQAREPEKQRQALRVLFRRVFGTPEGKQVLTVILEDLKFYDPAETDADKALTEYAKFLLSERLGISDSYAATEAILGAGNETGREGVPRRVT